MKMVFEQIVPDQLLLNAKNSLQVVGPQGPRPMKDSVRQLESAAGELSDEIRTSAEANRDNKHY